MRVLMASYGSAGDVFPLVPIAEHLRGRGVDVRFAAPRSTGLYLRTAGLRCIGLGGGQELRVTDDAEMFSLRFDGWSSWRRTVLAYVLPALEPDVAALEQHFTSWRPDVVVCMNFAIAARIAAQRQGIPVVDASIYPQHEALDRVDARFCRELVARARTLLDHPASMAKALWGAPADVHLHDQAVLPPSPTLPVVGFPYWDQIPSSPSDAARLDAWLDEGDGQPTILVTMGSFVGASVEHVWAPLAAEVRGAGLRAAFLGPRGEWGQQLSREGPGITCHGFLPLSGLLHRFDGVVHHGGIGTTFATLRAGLPAVIAPQAFDQGFNARLIASSGAAVDARTCDRREAIRRLVDDPALRQAAARVADRLTPTATAADGAAQMVLARA